MPHDHLKVASNESGERLRELAQNNSGRSFGQSEYVAARGDRRQLLPLIMVLLRETTALRAQHRIDPMTGLYRYKRSDNSYSNIYRLQQSIPAVVPNR